MLCRVELKDNMGYISLREPVFWTCKGAVAGIYDGDRVIGSGTHSVIHILINKIGLLFK